MIGAGAVATLAGCAGKRIVDGVFHSPKGYRVALPRGDWEVTRTRADLELRHRRDPVGIAVNAACERVASRASLDILVRHLVMGLRDRSIVSTEEIMLNGSPTRHSVIDGRLGQAGTPVRVESYIVQGERCVYDLLYAGPRDAFAARRQEFQGLVDSFTTE